MPVESRGTLSAGKAARVLDASFAKGRNPAVRMLGGSVVGWREGAAGARAEAVATTTTPELAAALEAAMAPAARPALCMRFVPDSRFASEAAGEAVHDGALCAALDAACANAVVWHTRLARTVATLEQQVRFFSHARVGEELYAVAALVSVTDSLAVLEAELRTGLPDGRLVARSSQSNALLALPPPKAKL
jgi:acyl-coenzyme A thioesterase PaaI-like protein